MSSLRAARLGAAGAYFTQGLLFISLTTRLPRFEHAWDLTEITLSLLLLMVVLLAGAGSALAEAVAARYHSALVTRAGVAGIGIGMAVLSLAPNIGVFIGGLVVYGVGMGALDAGANMQFVALEHRYGEAITPSFYGAWTTGGIVATLASIGLAGWSLGAGSLVLLVFPLVALFLPLVDRDDAAPRAGNAGLPWRRLALLGLAIVLFYMVDTAAMTWGPVFLHQVFDSPDRLVPIATLPYLVAAMAARFAGDGVVRRFGPVRVVRVGGLVAAVALLAVVASPNWPTAVLGFTVLGAAAAVIAPLSFSAAAAIAGTVADPAARQATVDQMVARFNQFNYVGALLGSVLTGIFGSSTLRIGYAVPMVLILAIIPLARIFAVDAL